MPSLNRFRPDIEGLRAIAILFVFLNHFFGFIGGFIGVDVFFVISGYVIISSILNELEHTGHFSVRKFYAKRIRRIVPAASLVLVTAAILVYSFFPVSERGTFGRDIFSAALWFSNFQFATNSVDYLAEGISKSPVLHFWSLSVEEQFYFVTPVILIALYLIFRGYHKNLIKNRFTKLLYSYLGIVIVIIITSFIFSIYFTSTNPSQSYFISPSRFWELGIGCLVAILYHRFAPLSISPVVSNILSVVGVLGLVVSAVLISDSTLWPSYMTLFPVISTALIIAAGCSDTVPLFNKIIGVKVMQKIGGLSYELYLWHWVILIVALQSWHQGESLNLEETLRLIALSIVFAMITKALISDPIRYSRTVIRKKRLTYSIGAFAVSCSVIAGVLLIINYNVITGAVGQQTVDVATAQKLTQDDIKDSYTTIYPNPANAMNDIPLSYAENCVQNQDTVDSSIKICERGDLDSNKLIIAVGDSMLQQWESALDQFGKDYNYHVEMLVKSNCVWMNATQFVEGQPNGRYKSCHEWSNNVLDYTIDKHPDLFISSLHAFSALNNPDDISSDKVSARAAQKGLYDYWTKLIEKQIKIAYILKNPILEVDGVKVERAYDCVEKNSDNLSDCQYSADNHVADAEIDAINSFNETLIDNKIGIIDLNSFICLNADSKVEKRICPAVIGKSGDNGLLVYRQGSHLTNTFVRSLTPRFIEQLETILNIPLQTSSDFETMKENR